MALDKKDREILFALDLNARIPLKKLAKKVRLSAQTAKYRIEQLEKNGVIKGYVTLFDVSKLGYEYFRLYVRFEGFSQKDEKAFFAYLNRHQNVVWFVNTIGRYDAEVLFVARSFIHFNQILREMREAVPNKFFSVVPSVSIANYHHTRAYLINAKSDFLPSYGGEPKKANVDEADAKIIHLLNQNARISNSELGKTINLNYKTVQNRIKALVEKGVIKAYRTWLDFSKLGSIYYKILVKLRHFSLEDELKILEFCKQNQNIVYFITCIWPWDIELEMEVESEQKFLEIIKSFRQLMGGNILDYETLTVTKEHKMNYCPFSEESI